MLYVCVVQSVSCLVLSCHVFVPDCSQGDGVSRSLLCSAQKPGFEKIGIICPQTLLFSVRGSTRVLHPATRLVRLRKTCSRNGFIIGCSPWHVNASHTEKKTSRLGGCNPHALIYSGHATVVGVVVQRFALSIKCAVHDQDARCIGRVGEERGRVRTPVAASARLDCSGDHQLSQK